MRAAAGGFSSVLRDAAAEEGLVWGRRALELDPEDAGVRYNVGCLYAVEGRVDEALECLEGALGLGFGNREWLARDPDLANLREDPRFKALLGATGSPETPAP